MDFDYINERAKKWIDVKDRLPNKDENVLVVMQDTDEEIHVEIRWRSIYGDVIVDENGFAIYPPVESRVIAWMPIPNYYKNKEIQYEIRINRRLRL